MISEFTESVTNIPRVPTEDSLYFDFTFLLMESRGLLIVFICVFLERKLEAFVVETGFLNGTNFYLARAPTIFGLFPSGGKLFYRQDLMRPALAYALDYVEKNTLPYLKLDIEYISTNDLTDCEGLDTALVWKTIEETTVLYVQDLNQHVAYFGPGCVKGVVDMAGWARSKNLPIFDALASASYLRTQNKFPTLTRTGYTDERLHQFFEYIMADFGLNNITIMGDERDPIWRNIMGPLRPFRSTLIDVTTRFIPICIENNTDYKEILEDIKYESTAIFLFGHSDCVKNILVDAVRMNLTDEPNPMTFVVTHFFDSEYWGSLDNQFTDDATDPAFQEDLERAFNRTFVVSYYMGKNFEARVHDLKEDILEFMEKNPNRYSNSSIQLIRAEPLNPTVLGYYAAVHVFGKVIKALLDPCLEASVSTTLSCRNFIPLIINGNNVAAKIQELKSFDIPALGVINFDANNDISGSFVLKTYNVSKRKFTDWMVYEYSELLPIKLHNQTFIVVSRKPLRDPDDSFLTELRPAKKSVQEETIALISVLLILLVLSGVVIRHYVQKARLGSNWWKIEPHELSYINKANAPHKSLNPTLEDSLTIATGFTYFDILKYKDLELAHYRDQLVAVRKTERRLGFCEQDQLKELRDIRAHNHPNLVRLYGLSIQGPTVLVATEHCSRGNLAELFVKQQMELDWSFRYSLLHDLFEGVNYIHSIFGYHGRLSSFCTMVDRTFVLKVRDHAPKCLQQPRSEMEAWDQLWTAPEILRNSVKKTVFTRLDHQKADVYSIGIIMQEIAMESSPFPDPISLTIMLPASEILSRVAGREQPPFRPIVAPDACVAQYRSAMESCWSELPSQRPPVSELRSRLRKLRGPVKGNILDDLLRRLQVYADQLQELVEERTQQLRDEQMKIQSLLYELLPKSVADKLISSQPVEPEPFECVTVYFSDIVSFTTISAESTPNEVVTMLNQLYSLFDSIIDNFDAYKVETIGDAYMVVSGLPKRNGCLHASIISQLALRILKAVENFSIPHRPDEKMALRIGIHSGPCVAGIVGNKMPRYCLFGDTINTASRMESTSEANRIQLSSSTYQNVRANPEFIFEPRGFVNIKGKGQMETYWLTSARILPDPVLPVLSHSNSCIPSTLNHRQSLRKRKSIDPFSSRLEIEESG